VGLHRTYGASKRRNINFDFRERTKFAARPSNSHSEYNQDSHFVPLVLSSAILCSLQNVLWILHVSPKLNVLASVHNWQMSPTPLTITSVLNLTIQCRITCALNEVLCCFHFLSQGCEGWLHNQHLCGGQTLWNPWMQASFPSAKNMASLPPWNYLSESRKKPKIEQKVTFSVHCKHIVVIRC